MCSCHSIPECCVMFSGVKSSMGSFVLLLLLLFQITHLSKTVFVGLTLFRSNLSKLLSTLGSIFHVFLSSPSTIFKFMSVLSQVCFICLLWCH